MSNSTPYAPQIKVPELLERGKTQLTTLPVYRDGALVVPTDVRYSLIAPDGTKIVDEAAGTYPGNISQYTHSYLSSTPPSAFSAHREGLHTSASSQVPSTRSFARKRDRVCGHLPQP